MFYSLWWKNNNNSACIIVQLYIYYIYAQYQEKQQLYRQTFYHPVSSLWNEFKNKKNAQNSPHRAIFTIYLSENCIIYRAIILSRNIIITLHTHLQKLSLLGTLKWISRWPMLTFCVVKYQVYYRCLILAIH